MTDFKELSPAELQLIMAKLFHHAWYDDNRGRFLLEILQDWEKNPCKEVKFLNEINNGKEELR
ncbi:hypothetical protein UFOVP316_38 [uncultured Caudovirales phage]|uniref:Uncharacterized protein n=1 Tax=uncultured Caudovirales phage TaxID=2100421 RepID=A0A6J5LSI2_9CAUD|nr:hypothetical protein UFOVP316_38 [uncultured Caudovirales phage]